MIPSSYTVVRRTATTDRGLIQATTAKGSSLQQCRDLARLDRQKLLELGQSLDQTVHLLYNVPRCRYVESIDRHGTSTAIAPSEKEVEVPV